MNKVFARYMSVYCLITNGDDKLTRFGVFITIFLLLNSMSDNNSNDTDINTPSEMLKGVTNVPLTDDQKKFVQTIDDLGIDAEDADENAPTGLPQIPDLKEEDITNLKQLLDSIMNDDRAVEKRIDYEYYANNKLFFRQFMDYSINNTIAAMDVKKYINKLTNFNYDPFEGIRSNLLFNVQDRLLYIHELGKVFDTDFLGKIDIQFKMHDIDSKLVKFIKNEKVPFNDFEHRLIKNMMGKLILAMYSNVERAFVQDNHCLSPDYLKNIREVNRVMENICYSDKYIMKSWNAFMNKLMDQKTMYKFKDYMDVSERLKDCYDNKFPIEIFMADCVKSLIPSIGWSYINAIKDVYIIGRLVSIYLNRYMMKRAIGDNAYRIRLTDMIIICRAVMVDYESNYFATSMIPRSMPKTEENMSEEVKLYYITHALTGPQYFLLKQLEYTLPSLV